jgi:hypothetical protein
VEGQSQPENVKARPQIRRGGGHADANPSRGYRRLSSHWGVRLIAYELSTTK